MKLFWHPRINSLNTQYLFSTKEDSRENEYKLDQTAFSTLGQPAVVMTTSQIPPALSMSIADRRPQRSNFQNERKVGNASVGFKLVETVATQKENHKSCHPKRIFGPLVAMSAAAEVTGRDRAKFFRRPLLQKGLPLRYIRLGSFLFGVLSSKMLQSKSLVLILPYDQVCQC